MRRLLDPFFAPARMSELEPVLRQVAADLLADVPRGKVVDAVDDIGAPFAVRGQSGWLGWPTELEAELLDWMADNHAASRSGELSRTAEVAERFDAIIRGIIAPRRAAGDAAPADVTTELMRLLEDEPDEVVVSVLRNWTGGDLGSIALCVGVLVHWLATHPHDLEHWRLASDRDLEMAIDEVLRIDDPFVSNRRVATTDGEIAGQQIAAGDRIHLNWTAANRDPRVFGEPESFDPRRNAPHNLVYGTGPHVCPGRPLATVELRVFVQELLGHVRSIAVAPGHAPERELPPVGGFRSVPVVLG